MPVILADLTKRELLLLAAESIDFVPFEHGGLLYTHYVEDGDACKDWDPMEDPGDALVLAIQLQLNVHNEQLGAGATYCSRYYHAKQDHEYFEVINSSTDSEDLVKQDYRDTYRAIVYAAATIALRNKGEQTQSR